ncbi:MAG: hypothetical protein FWE18_00135 [Alphaproteobacteria bacterium]|nr:hypothetical protein [Alphaproteobacteria bacterium]
MDAREDINRLLIIFDNTKLSDMEYTQFSYIYQFEDFSPQNIFNIVLWIIKHRLKRNTQTPYDKEIIAVYASNHELSIPYDLRELDKLSTEVLFGVIR